jgi:hypothetical protein
LNGAFCNMCCMVPCFGLTNAPPTSDYNFVRNGAQCDPVGPEPIPAGVCNSPDQMYKGSSGWRKIPGNTCQGGLSRDDKIDKKCSEGT